MIIILLLLLICICSSVAIVGGGQTLIELIDKGNKSTKFEVTDSGRNTYTVNRLGDDAPGKFNTFYTQSFINELQSLISSSEDDVTSRLQTADLKTQELRETLDRTMAQMNFENVEIKAVAHQLEAERNELTRALENIHEENEKTRRVFIREVDGHKAYIADLERFMKEKDAELEASQRNEAAHELDGRTAVVRFEREIREKEDAISKMQKELTVLEESDINNELENLMNVKRFERDMKEKEETIRSMREEVTMLRESINIARSVSSKTIAAYKEEIEDLRPTGVEKERLQGEIAALNAAADEGQIELTTLRAEIALLHAELRSRPEPTELVALRKEIAVLHAEIKRRPEPTELAALKAELAALHTEIRRQTDHLDKTQRDVIERELEVSSLEESVGTLEGQMNVLHAEALKRQAELAALQGELKSRPEPAELQSMRTELAHWQTELANREQQLAELRAEMTHTPSDSSIIAQLESEIQAANKEFRTVSNRARNLQRELDAAESGRQAMSETNITTLDKERRRWQKLEEDLRKEWKIEKEKQQAEINKLRDQLSEKDMQIGQMADQAKLSPTKEMYQQLEEQLSREKEKSKQVELLQTRMRATDDRFEVLRTNSNQLGNRLVLEESKRKTAEKELARIQKSLVDLEESIVRATAISNKMTENEAAAKKQHALERVKLIDEWQTTLDKNTKRYEGQIAAKDREIVECQAQGTRVDIDRQYASERNLLIQAQHDSQKTIALMEQKMRDCKKSLRDLQSTTGGAIRREINQINSQLNTIRNT